MSRQAALTADCPYPNLGYDPCPGDLAGYQDLAEYTARSAETLHQAASVLGSAGSDGWRGEAADAFRRHVQADVLPLTNKAAGSVGTAATALNEWTATLAGLQQEARALDRQAEPYRADLESLQGAAGGQSGSGQLTKAQQARADTATTALAGISGRADDIHARYLSAVQRTGSQLQDAGNMAPPAPGVFSDLWHGAEGFFDDVVHGVDVLVHDKALWQFIAGVANVVATVAGLLALFPPLTAIMGPIALGAAGAALVADTVLAAFDGGSWSAVALDAVAVLSDGAWMKSADELADVYKASKMEDVLTKATTWKGLVSKIPKIGKGIDEADKTKDVAPGMFRMISASFKTAAGDSADFDKLSRTMSDFNKYNAWRAVDIVAGQLAWTVSAAGIEAVPGSVRSWVNDLAAGQEPWTVPAS